MLQPNLIGFVYARKVKSLLIGVKTKPIHMATALQAFADGDFDDIMLHDSRIASIDRMHFPIATLDWPIALPQLQWLLQIGSK